MCRSPSPWPAMGKEHICVCTPTFPTARLVPAALYSRMDTEPRARRNLRLRLGDKQPCLNEDMIYLARLYPLQGTTGSFTPGAGTAGSSHGAEGTTDNKSAQHHQPQEAARGVGPPHQPHIGCCWEVLGCPVLDSTSNQRSRANLEGYSFAKNWLPQERSGGDSGSPALRRKLHFCLQDQPRQAHPRGKGQHYHAERHLPSAWEAKSMLKGAKSLLYVSKSIELLKRRDILRLQVEQRALQMAGIKCNGPLMANHLIAAGWFLSCGATPSSRRECGTDHHHPRELLVLVV